MRTADSPFSSLTSGASDTTTLGSMLTDLDGFLLDAAEVGRGAVW